jgi:hypothetical protein
MSSGANFRMRRNSRAYDNTSTIASGRYHHRRPLLEGTVRGIEQARGFDRGFVRLAVQAHRGDPAILLIAFGTQHG